MIKKVLVSIVLLVIVILVYFYGRDYRMRDKAKVIEANIVLDRIVIELEKFYFVCGRYPSAAEGLLILTTSACGHNFTLSSVNLRDPWDNEVVYSPKGNSFTISSLGLDGKPGGIGYDEDIVAPTRIKFLLEK